MTVRTREYHALVPVRAPAAAAGRSTGGVTAGAGVLLGVRCGRSIGNIILHGAVAVAVIRGGSLVRAQLRRLGALGYLQAPHRAAPPSHCAATRRSVWCAQARNGAAAVNMRGSAPVPLQPRPAVLGRYCRARQPAPALRTPSSDARSRARSVLSRRSGSRDLATPSAGTK